MDNKSSTRKMQQCSSTGNKKVQIKKIYSSTMTKPGSYDEHTAITFNMNTLTFRIWTMGRHSAFPDAIQGHRTCRQWTRSGASLCWGGIPLLCLHSTQWQHSSQSMATLQKRNPITYTTFSFIYTFITDIYIVPLQVGQLRSAPNPRSAE